MVCKYPEYLLMRGVYGSKMCVMKVIIRGKEYEGSYEEVIALICKSDKGLRTGLDANPAYKAGLSVAGGSQEKIVARIKEAELNNSVLDPTLTSDPLKVTMASLLKK